MTRCSVLGLAVLLWGAGGSAAGQIPDVDALLESGRARFNEFRYGDALEALAQAEGVLLPMVRSDEGAKTRLLELFAIRGRIHVIQQDLDAARATFRRLLVEAPDYVLPGPPKSTPSQIFQEVKQVVVGELEVIVEPVDATVFLGDRSLTRQGVLALVAGRYDARIERIGYDTQAREVSVTAGQRQRLEVRLVRRSAVARLQTSPPGVEILVNGDLRGVTQPGSGGPSPEDAGRDSWSAPFALADVRPTDVLTLRRDCYETKEHSFGTLTELRDYDFSVRLPRAEGEVTIDGPPGAEVILGGAPRGALPLAPVTLCEGTHRLEVRGPAGRFDHALTVTRGEKRSVVAVLRPSFALLHHVGREGYVGPDARAELARLFAPAHVGFQVPPPELVRRAMQGSPLGITEGFLAYDVYRRPVSTSARAPTPSALREESDRLSRALGAQGVAEIRLAPDAGPDRRKFLLTLLAAGSSVPDVVEVDLGRTDSIARAVGLVDAFPKLRRASLGLTLADVPHVGAVVSRVERGGDAAAAGVAPGDVLSKLDDEPISDVATIDRWLADRIGRRVVASLVDRAGRSRVVGLTVAEVPRLVAAADESWAFNALVPRFRSMLATRDDLVVRLNLAVALMAVKDFEGGLAQLSKVELPSGGGVSQGTVALLRAECLAKLGRLGDARAALEAAAASDGLLTEDGPPVRELAERRLAALGGVAPVP